MNTQTSKKAHRLNFFDLLLIVLAVLIIAGGAAFVVYQNSRTPENSTVIEYTVLVRDLPEEMNVRAEAGQTVIDTIRLGEIGEVVSLTMKPATYDAFDHTTETTLHGEYEDLNLAEFTFRADANKTESSYMINNVRVSVGAEVHFRTPTFIGFGYVTEVRELPAE